jgi:hypothetical protein
MDRLQLLRPLHQAHLSPVSCAVLPWLGIQSSSFDAIVALSLMAIWQTFGMHCLHLGTDLYPAFAEAACQAEYCPAAVMDLHQTSNHQLQVAVVLVSGHWELGWHAHENQMCG